MRLCKTCCTEHSKITMCPPHECRPTGMARYHIWMEYLETENKNLKELLRDIRHFLTIGREAGVVELIARIDEQTLEGD